MLEILLLLLAAKYVARWWVEPAGAPSNKKQFGSTLVNDARASAMTHPNAVTTPGDLN